MTWNEYLYFAIPAIICWLSAGILVYLSKKNLLPYILMLSGIVVFAVFIAGLWFGQQRPPLRTIGETRLWYSFFLSLIGFITFLRWKYKWMLSFSALMAIVFACINIFKPEIHSTNLMPALQSIWFVPHVTVYILSYAMFGASVIAAFIQLNNLQKNRENIELNRFIDNIVHAGFGFLILGMLMGAIWAKQAWGHYWSWDPKETWAFITAASYLVFIHIRLQNKHKKFALWLLPVSFILLMITWIGVNYLPAAQGSIHVYGN
ncbi:MAG: cytochrome c biogenesis protein CcsA [Tannerella sp.]|jgi:ABC-type transport system involved in cytochrome c biogenesis permease subunit|nr:cytochrome c biogenesis protein CcsA [Tannerella sp.]